MKKWNRGYEKGSHRHAHEFLVGLDDFVAHLDHELEGHACFLHSDHRLVNLVIFAEQNVARDGLGLRLLRVDRRNHLLEHVPKATGLHGAGAGVRKRDSWKLDRAGGRIGARGRIDLREKRVLQTAD